MKKVLCGNEMDRMPNWSFRIMAFMFKVTDLIKSPDRRLDPFGIQNGQSVVDWGYGTGRYLKQACCRNKSIHEMQTNRTRNVKISW